MVSGFIVMVIKFFNIGIKEGMDKLDEFLG